MWLGVCIGVVYAIVGFSNQGDAPLLCLTMGPFQNGVLLIDGYHVHHWIVCALLLPMAILLGLTNLAGFMLVMLLHGLTYADAFEL